MKHIYINDFYDFCKICKVKPCKETRRYYKRWKRQNKDRWGFQWALQAVTQHTSK